MDDVRLSLTFPDDRGIEEGHRLFKDPDPLGTRMSDMAEAIFSAMNATWAEDLEPQLHIRINDIPTGRGKDYWGHYRGD